MEQESSSMRERLLARMPRPENLASYREEVTVLLAKHERALATDMWVFRVLGYCAIGIFLLTGPKWGAHLDAHAQLFLQALAAVIFLTAGLMGVVYEVRRSNVGLLKEVKQVQLQVLELQASLNKESEG